MEDTPTTPEPEDDDLLPHYDFDYSKMRPNRFAARFRPVEEHTMSPTLQDLGIDRLSHETRLDLMGQLWDSLDPATTDDLAPEARAELDRRLDAADTDPTGGTPWEVVRERLRAKS